MPAINVGPLVGIIPTVQLTLRTYGAPTVDARGRSSESYTDTTIDATVHTAGRRLLQRLPEADRKREAIAVYTRVSLLPSDAVRSPRVQYAGRWYELQNLGDYGFLGGIYLSLGSLVDSYTEPPP